MLLHNPDVNFEGIDMKGYTNFLGQMLQENTQLNGNRRLKENLSKLEPLLV
ncbi:hypothetical protein [Bacillus cereus group sp. BfR-BA-01349]|uniref:hypothetical protein n=1 Tax=Bacillus cereus group sp. BfR-BA-01349 TaxID=2920312 RepID=UPI001F58922F